MHSAQQNAPTRPWWSRPAASVRLLSEKHTAHGASQKPKKFNTIASVIGLKPKKPVLAIQDPPVPVRQVQTPTVEQLALPLHSRPPTLNSWGGSTEPRTPSDVLKHSSMLTTSDLDPFVAHHQYIPSPTDSFITSPHSLPIQVPEPASSSSEADTPLSLTRSSVTSEDIPDTTRHASLTPQPPFLPPYRKGARINSSTSTSLPLPSRSASTRSEDRRPIGRTTANEKFIARESPLLPHDDATVPPLPTLDGSLSRADAPEIKPYSSSSTLSDKPRTPDAHRHHPRLRSKSRPRDLTGMDAAMPAFPSSGSDDNHLPSPPASSASRPRPRTLSSPLAITHQPSLSRMKALPAPAAPPVSGLPPTPPITATDRRIVHGHTPSPDSSHSTSSGISFATSPMRDSMRYQLEIRGRRASRETSRPSTSAPTSPPASKPTRLYGHEPSQSSPQHRRPSSSSRTEFSPARTLKKAISAQNLTKRTSNTSVVSNGSTTVEDVKSVKKQRSFHHSRLPIPPIPSALRHTSSSSSASLQSILQLPYAVPAREDSPGVTDHQVANPASYMPVPVMYSPPPGIGSRRRLFSSSSTRRSISSQVHSTSGDDDVRSVFSVQPSEDAHAMRHPRSGRIRASADSRVSLFWEELEPSGTTRASDYLPQHIIAPADMLRLEKALVQDSTGESAADFMRARGRSFTSVSTSVSGTFSDISPSLESDAPTPISPVTSASRSSASLGASRCELLLQQQTPHSQPYPMSSPSSLSPPPSLAPPLPQLCRDDQLLSRTLGAPTTRRRPATAQGDLTRSPRSLTGQMPSPPVTARSPVQTAVHSLNGLPLPPRSRVRPSTTGDRPNWRTSLVPITPLSPPPAWKGLGRRGNSILQDAEEGGDVAVQTSKPAITRRPSFLDIDESDDPQERRVRGSLDDSFLDMGKCSLDTVRSSLDDFGQ